MRRVFICIALCTALAISACGPLQQARKVGDNQYEIQITGNSINPLELTSSLHKAFDEKARSICPGGYQVLNKQLIRGRGHGSDVMHGYIRCQ